MRLTNQIITAVFFAIVLIGFSSCGSTGSDGESDFDRQAMLENYGSNVIIPSYETLQNTVDGLNSSATAFSNTPTTENLEVLQADLKKVRLAWQDASIFQFGPAGMQGLRGTLNTYPADTDQINSNIQSGDYQLGTIANQAAGGLPALGYLLHGTGSSNAEIISQYTTDTDADNRMQYMLDNVSFIKDNIDSVTNEWLSSGGDYISTFTSEENAGTDVGSSLGMLVNAMVLHYERFLRDGKVGIPSGVRSAGIPRPEATEAFYAGYSAELAVANLQAVDRLFSGTGLDNSDGLGLQEHIEALGAEDLSNNITTEFEEANTAVQDLSDPLSDEVENDNESVEAAFQELQDLVALLKADMSSVLGVTITFQDNDGD